MKSGEVGSRQILYQPLGSINLMMSDFFIAYFKREVLTHALDAWTDHDKTKEGYEIPFNRQLYVFEPPRPAGRD